MGSGHSRKCPLCINVSLASGTESRLCDGLPSLNNEPQFTLTSWASRTDVSCVMSARVRSFGPVLPIVL